MTACSVKSNKSCWHDLNILVRATYTTTLTKMQTTAAMTTTTIFLSKRELGKGKNIRCPAKNKMKTTSKRGRRKKKTKKKKKKKLKHKKQPKKIEKPKRKMKWILDYIIHKYLAK